MLYFKQVKEIEVDSYENIVKKVFVTGDCSICGKELEYLVISGGTIFVGCKDCDEDFNTFKEIMKRTICLDG